MKPTDGTNRRIVLTDAVAVTSAGNLDRLAMHEGPLGPMADFDQWRSGLEIPHKELKIADRQTLLLLRTLQALLVRNPAIDRERSAVHLAVGPARTDLETLLCWARRIEPGEIFPQVSPTAAIGLLPNMPLAWVSIQQHWRGEGAVFAGFEEAGFQAVAESWEAMQSGAPEAVVAAISSPDSYFVRPVLADYGLPADGSFPEIGVALHFRAESATDIPQPGNLVITALQGPSPESGTENFQGFHTPLRSEWGNPLVTAFPLALALAWAGAGSSRIPGIEGEFAVSDHHARWYSARMEASNG